MPGRVLIVDDDPSILALLPSYLTREGWKVHTVSTAVGPEALIVEFHPDIVLCDLCIPDRDAVEFLVARSSRPADDPVRRTPVVVMSAHDVIGDALDTDMDFVAIVRKPFCLRELSEALEAVLSDGADDPASLTIDTERGRREVSLKDTTVLAVDDNQDSLDLVCETLTQEGCYVACASSGPEAVQILRSMVPDVAVLDIMMPDMNGFALLDVIRRTPGLETVPVILQTAYPSREHGKRTVDLGLTYMLAKPLDVKLLVRAVKESVRATCAGAST